MRIKNAVVTMATDTTIYVLISRRYVAVAICHIALTAKSYCSNLNARFRQNYWYGSKRKPGDRESTGLSL